MKPTLTQLSEGFERALSMGYSCAVSCWSLGSSKIEFSVSLTKHGTYGSTQVGVQGKGSSVEAAFQSAFDNFPKNPLDGSQWIEANQPKVLTHED